MVLYSFSCSTWMLLHILYAFPGEDCAWFKAQVKITHILVILYTAALPMGSSDLKDPYYSN